jgi:DNA-binding ferritin-like protein
MDKSTNTSVDDKNLFPDGLEENTLSKFLSIIKKNDVKIISEGKGSSNRLTTAESMVIEQPVIRPRKEVTSPVLNVNKDATPSMIGKYFKTVEQEIKEAEERTRDRTKQLAERVADKINNESRKSAAVKLQSAWEKQQAKSTASRKRGEELMAKIKQDVADKAKKEQGVAETTGDKPFDKMLKGITDKKAVTKQQKADTKQQASDALGSMFGGGNPAHRLGIKKKSVSEAEGTPSGVAHLTRELLTHIVQQSGKEGAHAVVKSLEWGDGAAKELLHLIIDDLKDDIKGMDEAVNPAQQAAIAIAKKKAGKK